MTNRLRWLCPCKFLTLLLLKGGEYKGDGRERWSHPTKSPRSFRQNMAFQSGFYPLSTTPSLGNVVERMKEACHLHVSALLGTIISANLIFFFALGALIGQETESGFIRGAEIGAFYGAVVSIEVFQSSIQLWRLDESCLVYLHDVVVSLLSGTLVRERIAPAIRQRISLLETGGSTLTITGNNNADDSGNRESCSICLQDYQRGEIVRILPSCRHMFHLPYERCPSRYPLRGNPCVSQLAAVSFPTIPPPLSCSPPRLSPFSLLNAAVAPPGSPFRRVPVKELTSRHQSPHCASLSFALSLHLKSTAAAPPPATQPPLHIPQATTFSLMHPAVSLSAVECQTTGFT
ncbi:hypothetical protein YC2023_073264 [Brassica napus]